MFDANVDPQGYAALRAYEASLNNIVIIEV